jgi:glucosamine kinase
MNGVFMGVDGGGTRCRARLCAADGRPLGEGLGGPGNIWRDPAAAMASVVAAARAAAVAAGLHESVLGEAHAGLGMAGAGRRGVVERFLALPHPFGSITVDTDAYAAWLGAFGGADGAIVIAGTGSCGLAVIGGRRTYVGGYGAEISDEGSGAMLGREAVRRALWTEDGRAPPTALSAAVLARSGGREAAIDWARSAAPRDFAGLAPLVFEHAHAGDSLGRALVAESANAVARIAERLIAAGASTIALLGGVAEPLRPWLPAALRARLVAPRGDALDGAIRMARRVRERRAPHAA